MLIRIIMPWILFEAGALSSGITSSRVCTLLVDLNPQDIEDPLAQFNHTLPNREGMLKLVNTLNKRLGENALGEKILSSVFNTYWPQFERKFSEIIIGTEGTTPIKKERNQDDILSEVLFSVRSLDKRIRKMERERVDNNIDENMIHGLSLLNDEMDERSLINNKIANRAIKKYNHEYLDKADCSKLIVRDLKDGSYSV